MRSPGWLPLMMIITLIVIIAFQVYWIHDNYEREKTTMQVRAGVAFRETIRKLQTVHLNVPDSIFAGRPLKSRKVFISEESNTATNASAQSSGVVLNRLWKSVKDDSLNTTMIISANGNQQFHEQFQIRKVDSTKAFRFLNDLDIFQDTLKISTLSNAFSNRIKKDNLDIPFSITRSKGAKEKNELTDVISGIVNPVTYHLEIGNYFPYLFTRMLYPLLFSVFLIGVTIFSFLLLYRNVLRQIKLAEIKNDFISNITHELKTPIATVGVAIEALKTFNAMDDPEKTKEYLDISANELQRLGLLVDNVLRVSLFEKKQILVNREHLDMKKLAEEVLDTMRLQFRKKNAAVHFVAEEESLVVNGDKLHIMSVLYNLLDNSLKYNSEEIQISVRLYREGSAVIMQVADNGIGISSEYRSRIFDKFFRVPKGNNHSVKGYGLGLSYVSHIVEQHDGTIHVESEVNKGSTFTIKFPV
jgi:two-component system phosphate regulon sensor histidine kinase PhoR